MERKICEALGTNSAVPFGRFAGGASGEGRGYDTEKGKIFIKFCTGNAAKELLQGEFTSLKYIQLTKAITVPDPIAVVELNGDEWGLVTKYFEDKCLKRNTKTLAKQLAKMHMHNRLQNNDDDPNALINVAHPRIESFGFECTTFCGKIALKNDWNTSWENFFLENRLKTQMDMLIYKGYHELEAVWPKLDDKCRELLSETESTPSLVHGDLWSGNWGMTKEGPVIFDPASFYADEEYEQGIMNMFGGFNENFWQEYHKIMPKRRGRYRRIPMYELFHHLNHWNHFGAGYKWSTMDLIESIIAN